MVILKYFNLFLLVNKTTAKQSAAFFHQASRCLLTERLWFAHFIELETVKNKDFFSTGTKETKGLLIKIKIYLFIILVFCTCKKKHNTNIYKNTRQYKRFLMLRFVPCQLLGGFVIYNYK